MSRAIPAHLISARARPKTLTDQILAALADWGETRYRVAKNSGLNEPQLCRFAAGQGLSLPALDALVEIEQAEPTPDSPALGAFVDAWKAGWQDVKPTSQLVYGRCRKWLVACFGEDRPIDSITEGDADEWAAFLRSKLGENTARKIASVAKQVFKHAVRKRLIASNSFTDLSAAVSSYHTSFV